MDKLIDEISSVVAKYGDKIATESRFVNILRDLYPERDNPERYTLLGELIKQGTVAALLHCEKGHVKSFVEKQSIKFSRRHGSKQNDVTSLLYALAAGTGRITRADYNAWTHPTTPKPTSSSQPQNQNYPIIQNLHFNSSEVIALIWAFIGLCATPFLYLKLLTTGTWPFWAIVAVVILGIFTIVPASIVIIGDEKNADKVNPYLAGAHFLITICFCIFLTLAPFAIDWTYEAFESHYSFWFGSAYHSDFSSVASELKEGFESPSILTLILGAFCSLVALTPFGIYMNSKGVSSSTENRSIHGMTWAGLALFVVTLFFLILPPVVTDRRTKIANEEYAKEMNFVEELRKSRALTTKEMSFKDFYLGQDFKQCCAIAQDTSNYTIEEDSYPQYSKLKIDSIDYSSVVDTVLYLATDWDNQRTSVKLFFNNNKLIGMRIELEYNLDSLVAMYSRKYGKAEHIPKKKDQPHTVNYLDENAKENFSWTFNNAIIQIKEDIFSCNVIYLNRVTETMLKDLQAKEEAERQRQIKEEEISKQKAAEEAYKNAEQERKRRKENHNKAINQI